MGIANEYTLDEFGDEPMYNLVKSEFHIRILIVENASITEH